MTNRKSKHLIFKNKHEAFWRNGIKSYFSFFVEKVGIYYSITVHEIVETNKLSYYIKDSIHISLGIVFY